MSWLWLVAALAAPLLWAASNVVDEYLVLDTNLDAWSLVLVTGMFTSLPAVLVARGQWPGCSTFALALAAGATGVLVYVPYFKALIHEPASTVMLMWNLSPVLMLGIARFTIRERLAASDHLAVVLLVASASIAAYRGRRVDGRWSAALPLMVVASVLLAVSSILEKAVYDRLSFGAGLPWISLGGMVTTALTAVLAKKSRSLVWEAVRGRLGLVLAFNEALDLGAVCLVGLATSLHSVSLVHAVSGLQPLFVLMLRPLAKRRSAAGAHFLKTVIASGLAIAGLALISS